ncbi:hypothetical protein ACSBR1_019510 [Camellia fascicularis]
MKSSTSTTTTKRSLADPISKGIGRLFMHSPISADSNLSPDFHHSSLKLMKLWQIHLLNLTLPLAINEEKEQRPPKDHHDENGEREQPPSHLFETAHSFCHPTVDMIINRFLSWDAPLNSGTHQLVEAHRNACVRDLNLHLNHVQALLDVEKQRGTALDQLRMAAGQCEHHWW